MAVEDDDRAGRDPAPAVTRSIRLMGFLADADRPLTLTEIAGGLGLAKSSTMNLCLALEGGRMIERVPGGYRLGVRTAELGGAFAARFNQIREFYAVCDASPVLSGELVQVAMRDERDALYLARHEGASAVRYGTPLGSRLPVALTAAGRALLMTMDDAGVVELLEPVAPFPQVTERSTTTLSGLLRKLARFREQGWALDEGEAFPGMAGVGVPLEPWAPGDPQFALGAGIPVTEATPERIERIAAALVEAARALTNPFSAAATR